MINTLAGLVRCNFDFYFQIFLLGNFRCGDWTYRHSTLEWLVNKNSDCNYESTCFSVTHTYNWYEFTSNLPRKFNMMWNTPAEFKFNIESSSTIIYFFKFYKQIEIDNSEKFIKFSNFETNFISTKIVHPSTNSIISTFSQKYIPVGYKTI